MRETWKIILLVIAVSVLASSVSLVIGAKSKDAKSSGPDSRDGAVLRDRSGRIRAELKMDEDVALLRLLDGDGRERLSLSVASSGEPEIWMYDEANAGRLKIGLAGGVSPFLSMFNSRGDLRVTLLASDNDVAALDLYDRESGEYVRVPIKK